MVKKIYPKKVVSNTPFKMFKLAFFKKSALPTPPKYSLQNVKVSLLKKVLYLPPLKYSLQDVKVSLLKKVLHLPPLNIFMDTSNTQ